MDPSCDAAAELSAMDAEPTLEPATARFSGPGPNPLEDIIGQPRVTKALDLAAAISRDGYNLYVSMTGETGHCHELLRRALQERTYRGRIPPDWIYLHNFDTPDQPLAVSLAAGQGRPFRSDMERLVKRLQEELPRLAGSGDLKQRKQQIYRDYEERGQKLTEQLEHTARAEGLTAQYSQSGIALVPVKDDRPMKTVEIQDMSSEDREELRERQHRVAQEVADIVARKQELEREAEAELEKATQDFVGQRIEPLIKEVADRYEQPSLERWFQQLRRHVVDNLDQFTSTGSRSDGVAQALGLQPAEARDPYHEFKVNLVVDNADLEGPPVVVESAPNYKNLFGILDHTMDRSGARRSDFSRIKAGSLLKANGGYVIFDLLDALREPVVWKELKRMLKSGHLSLEVYEPMGLFSISALKPDAIPVRVKLVAVGTPQLYQLLYQYDEDFADLFKVKAEFDASMELPGEASGLMERMLQGLAETGEDVREFSPAARTELIRCGCRIAGYKNKMTSRFDRLADVAREASYWAERDDSATVLKKHVRDALDNRVYRSDLIAEKIRELISDGSIRLDVHQRRIGQLNGISLVPLGDCPFGRPARVTSSVGIGQEGIINIERESHLSGGVHDKGVLIVEGYLRNQYGLRHPLALSASIAFEQSYGLVDGDSASVAELLALLSGIGAIPLRQDVAVTGSVNQWGEVQAIGGVNEKIEGFYDVCHQQGLTQNQGVAVPAANVKNLVLRPDVVSAIKAGVFHLWAVDRLDQALSLFSELHPGDVDDLESFHGKVNHRLWEFAEANPRLTEMPGRLGSKWGQPGRTTPPRPSFPQSPPSPEL